MDHYTRSRRNAFVMETLNRVAEHRQNEARMRSALEDQRTRFMPVWRSKVLVSPDDAAATVELDRHDAAWLLQSASHVIFLGELDGHGPRFAINVDREIEDVAQHAEKWGGFTDLRMASRILNNDHAGLLAYAKAISDWQDNNRFCALCAHPLKSTAAGHIMVCTNQDCGKQVFPRMDPAVIVSVTTSDAILLGRQGSWPPGQYSVVAGFVEAGESLEQAVKREVMEETGISVSDIHYLSSQPWPFPSSIMLGFTAAAQNMDITHNDDELEDARWMTREEISQELHQQTLRLPTFVSISFRLIEDWFDQNQPGKLADLIEQTGGQRWRHPSQS